MSKKRRLIIGVIILTIVVIFIYVLLILKNVNENEVIEDAINLGDFRLKEREVIFFDNYLLVGENRKELENGYYDFKIQTNSNEVVISLNKLWYERFGADYIQDEYLAKVCREVIRVLKYNGDKEKLEYELYKYIKDNYVSVKAGETGETLMIGDILISSKSKDGECVVYIKVE